MKNLFITIEGCDGAGKSTAANYIFKYLKSKGIDVIKTREPGGNKVAEKFRDIIVNEKISPEAEALTFAAARIEHIKEIVKPALESNKWVVCDRYFDSSIVYQGYARGLGIEEIKNINWNAIENFTPDLTIVLDVDINIAQKRINDHNREINRLDNESKEFHMKCKEGFKKLPEFFPGRNIKFVESSDSIEKMNENILKIIKEVLDET